MRLGWCPEDGSSLVKETKCLQKPNQEDVRKRSLRMPLWKIPNEQFRAQEQGMATRAPRQEAGAGGMFNKGRGGSKRAGKSESQEDLERLRCCFFDQNFKKSGTPLKLNANFVYSHACVSHPSSPD